MSENNNPAVPIRYDINDDEYAGARGVVEKELEHLKIRRGTEPDNIYGLALSGGGIRSASFCLGVVQALSKQRWLEKFDYMSTVSGGSYLGGSLSWLWLNKWKDKTECTQSFGTQPENFPYGTGYRHSNPAGDKADRNQAALMRHLRQHGNYMVPGHGITTLSFLSVMLRSITMGFVTLIVIASIFFHAFNMLGLFNTGWYSDTIAMDLGMIGLCIYFLALLSYGLLAICHSRNPTCAYLGRRQWEIGIKYILIFSIVALLIALVSELSKSYSEYMHSTGSISALTGALLTWSGIKIPKDKFFKTIPSSILIYGGVLIMFLGMFVLADLFSELFTEIDQADGSYTGLLSHLVIVAIVLLSAYFIPINKVSIHRYYRDRLMETFNPDACDTLNNKSSHVSLKANQASLHDCLPDDDNTMPFHIINSNLILVESEIPKFRGRGGDNFILTPLYSGSNATGWLHSSHFAGDSITLPTAVAISGAAANSDSGMAGEGVTINPFLSALMSIFNLRLGYWTTNPETDYQPNQKANPNFLIPGFRGVFNRGKLNEKANFIQLSDGGHFENLGLYELLRRKCKLIVCCDAEEDRDFAFNSLSNIIEKARVDFGIKIDISAEDLQLLKYHKQDNGDIKYANQGYLLTDIIYPGGVIGKLIYIKTTLPEELPADVIAYKYTHPSFPDESTVDQLFDEKQLEAYRMLGAHIGESLKHNNHIESLFDSKP